MPEPAFQPMPMIDDILHSQNLALDQHFIPDGAAAPAASRVTRLRTLVGDGQTNEWIMQIAEESFDRGAAVMVLQNAARKKDKALESHEMGRIFNALVRMYRDHMDLNAGNTTAISKRYETRAIPTKAQPKGEQTPQTYVGVPAGHTRAPQVDIESSLRETCMILLAVADSMPFPMDEKIAFHRTMERIADSRMGQRTYGLIKFGFRERTDED